jgi:hypothetical protein
MAPNSPECSFIHASMAGSRSTAPLNRSNSVLIIAPLFFGVCGDWQGSAEASGSRQDAHESNDVGSYRLGSERILHLQADKIATVAEHSFRLDWQLAQQRSPEFCSRARLTNDKRTRSSDIHDARVAQFPCEDAWAKRPVPANVDATNENDKSHSQEGNLNSSPGSGSNQVAWATATR